MRPIPPVAGVVAALNVLPALVLRPVSAVPRLAGGTPPLAPRPVRETGVEILTARRLGAGATRPLAVALVPNGLPDVRPAILTGGTVATTPSH